MPEDETLLGEIGMPTSSAPQLLQFDVYDPSVVTLADGGRILFWAGDDQDGRGIWAQRYDAAGDPVGAIYQINDTTADEQSLPDVITLSDGTLLVTWISGTSILYDDLSVGTIRGQRLDANGNPIGSEFAVNPNSTANYSRNAEITALDDGGFVAVYYSYYSDSSLRSVYGQRFDANGAAVGGEFRIGSVEGSAQNEPDVAGLVNGGFVVTWSANRGIWGSDGGGGIFGQIYDANGAAIGTEFHINTTTSGAQEDPRIVALPDGGYLVAWLHDATVQELRFQRYDGTGATVGDEGLFALDAALDLDYAGQTSNGWAMITLQDGGVAIAWRDISSADDDLHIQSFDLDGNAITEVTTIETQQGTSGNSDTYTIDLDQQTDGTLIATWEYEANDEIYTQTIDAPPISPFGSPGALSGAQLAYVIDAKYVDSQGDAIFAASDFIVTGVGADSDSGLAGNDMIFGGIGENTLYGGADRDQLYGEEGADVFIYKAADEPDLGADFSRLEGDMVQMENAGNQNLTNLMVVEIITKVILTSDEHLATVENVTDLSTDDLVLV